MTSELRSLIIRVETMEFEVLVVDGGCPVCGVSPRKVNKG